MYVCAHKSTNREIRFQNVHANVWYDSVCICARIDLKIYMSRDIYVDILGLKFEKDLFSGCGEIDDLLGQHN